MRQFGSARQVAAWLVMTAALALLAACGGRPQMPSQQQPPPPPPPIPALTLAQVVSGLVNPVDLQSPRDGSGRLFIVEQAGRIRILQAGMLVEAPFLDIRGIVTSGGERGLLGLAFHPNYAANGRFYINYTRTTGGQLESAVAEYQRSAGDPLLADPGSARVLFTVNQPFTNHNGGQLAFGSDGFLYIALGDGGSAGDPLGNGQNRMTLLGAILRIDVNGTSLGREYAVPPTNPFVGDSAARDEIWAYGLRNPWRFSFDRPTGRMFIADVGQSAREEVNLGQAGANYGWNIMEGSICYPPPSTGCNTAGLTLPITELARDEARSVTGGFVYRGSAMPGLVGVYVFGDFITGRIWTLQQRDGVWVREPAMATNRGISSFGEDQNGNLYVLDYSGAVLRLVAQ